MHQSSSVPTVGFRVAEHTVIRRIIAQHLNTALYLPGGDGSQQAYTYRPTSISLHGALDRLSINYVELATRLLAPRLAEIDQNDQCLTALWGNDSVTVIGSPRYTQASALRVNPPAPTENRLLMPAIMHYVSRIRAAHKAQNIWGAIPIFVIDRIPTDMDAVAAFCAEQLRFDIDIHELPPMQIVLVTLGETLPQPGQIGIGHQMKGIIQRSLEVPRTPNKPDGENTTEEDQREPYEIYIEGRPRVTALRTFHVDGWHELASAVIGALSSSDLGFGDSIRIEDPSTGQTLFASHNTPVTMCFEASSTMRRARVVIGDERYVIDL